MAPFLGFLAFAIAIIFIVVSVKRMLIVVKPNEALIVSGPTRQVGRNEFVGYEVTIGGRVLRIPLFQRVDRIDLKNISIDVEVHGAFSKGGIPLNIKAVANVKIPSEEPMLRNAVERFLGRTQGEITYIAKETLEGNLRGVLAQLTPEEVNEDKNRFAHILTEEAEHDLAKLGIKLDQLKIQNVTDDVGYLNSIGRIRGAELLQRAKIAEARTKADAAVQKAINWQASELAKTDAEIAIAEREMAKRVMDAKTRREAMIADSEGKVKAEIAKVSAEIKRQQARVVQVERQLMADVIQPADAERMKLEQEAAANAATIVERGLAEAAGLHELVEAYRRGGNAAKEALVLQSLLPMFKQIAGAEQPASISKLTLLPQPIGGTDPLTRKLLGANAEVKAVTGVDLASIASKYAQK
ncbi:MAG: SPFH domain-containing protein [Polyangiaceae bacterium]|nr:SPFH domain-containing protein [Polyangiaceae bacterium]